MKVHRLHPADLSDDWIRRLNECSVMTSVGFLHLWETVGGRAVVWAVEEDGQLLALLPALEFGTRPVARLQAMPDGLYAHLVELQSDQWNRAGACRALFRDLGKAGYAKLSITDYFGELTQAGEFERTELSVSIIDLDAVSWEPPDTKLRSEIRKAEREGVSIQPFNRHIHLAGFIELMKQTEARHGRAPKYPDAFFERLAEISEQDARIVWWYVEHEGAPVASHIYFLDHHISLNWQIYFNKQYSSLKANQFILFTAAKEFAQRGIRRLNLGATPDEAEGVKAYKEKWGGIEYAYPRYTRHSLLGRLA